MNLLEKLAYWIVLINQDVVFVTKDELLVIIGKGTRSYHFRVSNYNSLVLFIDSCPWVPFVDGCTWIRVTCEEPFLISSKPSTKTWASSRDQIRHVCFRILISVSIKEDYDCTTRTECKYIVVICGKYQSFVMIWVMDDLVQQKNTFLEMIAVGQVLAVRTSNNATGLAIIPIYKIIFWIVTVGTLPPYLVIIILCVTDKTVS